MSEVSTDKKLKGKDLITIGIFSAIYFVINFAFMLLGGIHPVLWMLMPGFIAVFAGIPFMLMVAKVQKLGAVFLMGLITALIYFATGQFTLVILISMASTCILAEVVRAVTKYNSFKGNSIAYVIFSLGMVGSPLPIWLFKADFLAQITEQGMPADYVAAVEALSSNAMLIVLFVAPIIGGKCSEYEKQLEDLRDQKQALFERYLLGQIELDTYKSRKTDYDAEIRKVKNAYAAVTAQAKLKREEQARQSNRQEIVHSIAEADALTSELTDLLIEKVYIFPDNRIGIVYKVHDRFE